MERGAYINDNKELIEKQWNDDLKYWLKNVKNIHIIDDRTLMEWDAKLNDITNKDDIVSFCKHTNWHFKHSL